MSTADIQAAAARWLDYHGVEVSWFDQTAGGRA
jgi:hypothetical protein